jgi:uncharacterized membrane protein
MMSLRRARLALAAIALANVAAAARAGDVAPPASPAPAAEIKIDGHKEDWWRAKAAGYREKLSKAEQHVVECEKKADANRRGSGLKPLDACASQLWMVERAENHQADFEADAREQGVPSAWIH